MRLRPCAFQLFSKYIVVFMMSKFQVLINIQGMVWLTSLSKVSEAEVTEMFQSLKTGLYDFLFQYFTFM